MIMYQYLNEIKRESMQEYEDENTPEHSSMRANVCQQESESRTSRH